MLPSVHASVVRRLSANGSPRSAQPWQWARHRTCTIVPLSSMTPEVRRMLINAALACGKAVAFKEGVCKGGQYAGCFVADAPWRPDTDDGDGARMEARLSISVRWTSQGVVASAPGMSPTVSCMALRKDFPDPQAARRWAVLNVASGLGESFDDANRDS
jgi:hypothetical protein